MSGVENYKRVITVNVVRYLLIIFNNKQYI